MCACQWKVNVINTTVSLKLYIYNLSYCNRVYCIHVPGHDPLTFLSGPFPFWLGGSFMGPVIYGVKSCVLGHSLASVVCDSEACVWSVYTVRRVFECGRCSFPLDTVVVCGEYLLSEGGAVFVFSGHQCVWVVVFAGHQCVSFLCSPDISVWAFLWLLGRQALPSG